MPWMVAAIVVAVFREGLPPGESEASSHNGGVGLVGSIQNLAVQ